MDKGNPNILQSLNFKNQYDVIRHDRVSWRKKSSYRKPIKRRMNKSLRRGINYYYKIYVKIFYNTKF